jgi:ABC-type Na+ efflux pump permease subunit
MNTRAIYAIARKDVTVALRSKAVALPLIFVPLLVLVGMPILMGFILSLADRAQIPTNDIDEILAVMPPAVAVELANLRPAGMALVFFLAYLFAPLYLILPIMVSSVIAADSFAGEKERKTLEALVYTPTTDRELLLAKVLGGWVPGVLVGLLGFVVYTVVADIVAWPLAGRLILPSPTWVLLAFWVGPAAAALALGATVLVSSRVNTFQDAYQVGSLVVLPVVILVLAQVMGVLVLDLSFVALLGAALWALSLGVFLVGASKFTRSEMIARL